MKRKGNLGFRILIVITMVVWGCSPKVVAPPKTDVAKTPVTIEKPIKKFTEANISLLIPFKLNQLNLQTATKTQVDGADMAIDFYQGIKLGIDSAASAGLNFKLNVFDTRDDNSQLDKLQAKESLKNSNLIIGPVFPEGLSHMTSYVMANDLMMVSPLAASKPSDFNNPKLISIVNNIDQHAAKIASYIGRHYQGNKTIVVLINPKNNSDEQFAAPLRNYLKQKYPTFIVQEFASAYTFETKMIKGKQYALVICSSDMKFVTPSIDKLYKLKNLKTGGYPIDLFGHPNWAKQNYNIDQLQNLNTIISTSYHIDYKSAAVIGFIKKYRAQFNFEPSEYSFKGFDIGFYFGKLLAKYGLDYQTYLTREKYIGLHNSFDFEYNPKFGYFNKDLMLLQYKNLTLNIVN